MTAEALHLHRTLDQELVAILRGASLECPVCGEFLLHRLDGIGCPECGLELAAAEAASAEPGRSAALPPVRAPLPLDAQAG